jgi:hypothetical protein
MINFFRNTRKKMADDNRPIKYMRYAIGEIVLVVIGILIALQINTWNQERISKIEESSILKNIHAEFLQNKEALNTTDRFNKDCYNTTRSLIQLVGKSREEIMRYNPDSLLFLSLETGTFRPSENTISDLIQSGRLQILHNEGLKILLYQWSSAMKSYNISSLRRESKIDTEIVPYLSKKYAMKDMDVYGQLEWKNRTQIKIDKFQIFEDIQFENIMDDYLYRLIGEKETLNELKSIIDNILKETE